MDVHSGGAAAFFVDGAQVFPAVSLVKGGMVGYKIEGIDPVFFHFGVHEAQEASRNSSSSAFGLGI